MIVHSNSAAIRSDFWRHSVLRLDSALIPLREITVTVNNGSDHNDSLMGGTTPPRVVPERAGSTS